MTTHKKGVMYVYKLDTGNHQPEPTPPRTTTAKKTITHTLGALFNRSKTYQETNHHHNSNKQDTQKVVFDGGRRSVPAVQEGEKSVSMIEKGRKTVSGTGEGRKPAVAGRRSAENRAEMVMVDVGMVAELLRVRVLVTDMPGFMQVHAFRCARQTLGTLEKFSPKQVAFNIKKEFDKVYGPAWHCIVGSSFGSFVTHATGCFLYFSMEKLYILVFKTKVQKTVKFSP
ncbi:putative dynein ATPase [Helianthus annuus]|nr:putative dynein ATPase [Helianthus annuus]KAJ0941955.1 putative dynein ATPase [Helianthus annuus]